MDNAVPPFLKWAGNKYQLRQTIIEKLPPGKRLIEPFVGAGAIFLNSSYPRCIIADINETLIDCYQFLKDEGETFIRYVGRYFTPETNNKADYYALREQYNKTKSRRKKAAIFLYLNRHGYNGLCRHNSAGKFNVPFGYRKCAALNTDSMRTCHQRLQTTQVHHQSFVETFKLARPGDVIYCDPPYVPISKTSSFTQYSQDGFDDSDQQMLATLAHQAAAKGIAVIVSNNDTDKTRTLYRDATITSFTTKRTISNTTKGRQPVQELIAVYR